VLRLIVRNELFADKHDYSKYDLWLHLAEGLKVKNLTLIPMLIPNEAKNEGLKTAFPEGRRRKRLYCFLQFCLVPNRRSITRLREFLCDEPFEYHPFRVDDDKGFQDGSWDAYFRSVPREWLCDAAILIDPDTGLETNSGRSQPQKYITYKNVATVVNRCSGSSVVVVVQFLQKNAFLREGDLNGKARILDKELRSAPQEPTPVHWIAEKTTRGLGELAFFVISAHADGSNGVERLLNVYARKHDQQVGTVKGVQRIATR
jgi:hypothetical protein